MKTLILTTLLTMIYSTVSMAVSDKTCYPLEANQDGFNRVCVAIENAQDRNTVAEIEVYRFEKMVKHVTGHRVWSPQERVCNNPAVPHCYRKYEALKVMAEVPNDFGLEISMKVSRSTNCLSGNLVIREQQRDIKLAVVCSSLSWGKN